MQSLAWLRRHWLGVILFSYFVFRIMSERGSFLQNATLLALVVIGGFRKPSQALPVLLTVLAVAAGSYAYEGWLAPQAFLRSVQQTAPVSFPTVTAQVYLGGERLVVIPMTENSTSRYSSRACFHTQTGYTLATAHGVSYDSGKVLVRLADSPTVKTEYATIACNDFGVVFPTLREPNGELMPIANIEDIKLGAAQVHQVDSLPIQLDVKGYYQSGQVTFLILWGESPCIPGYSGSPIVQDGKLVGSVYGYLKVSNHIWLARLAVDLYRQVETSVQRVAIRSQIPLRP